MKIYEIDEWIDILFSLDYKTLKNNKRIEYLDITASYDIETSSFMDINNQKAAIMYAFMIDIEHYVYYGRTWDDFKLAIEAIKKIFRLSHERRMIIYVHNLSYEFQFMSKRLEWEQVFALEERKICYAVSGGIEFRCSYLMSGYSLNNVATIEKLPIKKLVGNLDYSLIRTPETEMTEKEIEYLYNDVEVVAYLIDKRKKNEAWIDRIPITKTSYVRRHTRENCDTFKYKKIISSLTIRPEEYPYLKKAFAGGFTHANMFNRGKIFENVHSFDFTSSYPAVMIAEKYPMSKGTTLTDVDEKLLEQLVERYCCIIDIEYFNIESNNAGDHIISFSRAKTTDDYFVDNGRIIMADNIRLTITEQDYLSIKDFYDYEDIKVHKVIYYSKGYLPKEFMNTILQLYRDKTELKGVDEREYEYMNSKEMVNALYGMIVTDILRDEILFNNGDGIHDKMWLSDSKNLEEAISLYNKSYNRFLYYPWGVWVTAYARRNLFQQ